MFSVIVNENQTENVLDTIQNNCGYKEPYKQAKEAVGGNNLDTNYFIKSELKHLKSEVDRVTDTQKRIIELQQDIIRVKPYDVE
jgi:hypothetical protein